MAICKIACIKFLQRERVKRDQVHQGDMMGFLSFICCCLHHRPRVCGEGPAGAAGGGDGGTVGSPRQPLNTESPVVPTVVPHFPVNPNFSRL